MSMPSINNVAPDFDTSQKRRQRHSPPKKPTSDDPRIYYLCHKVGNLTIFVCFILMMSSLLNVNETVTQYKQLNKIESVDSPTALFVANVVPDAFPPHKC